MPASQPVDYVAGIAEILNGEPYLGDMGVETLESLATQLTALREAVNKPLSFERIAQLRRVAIENSHYCPHPSNDIVVQALELKMLFDVLDAAVLLTHTNPRDT